jgi:hypothetical protein
MLQWPKTSYVLGPAANPTATLYSEHSLLHLLPDTPKSPHKRKLPKEMGELLFS